MKCKICNGEAGWFTQEIYKCSTCKSLIRKEDVNYKKKYKKDYWFDITKKDLQWVIIEQSNQANYYKVDLIGNDIIEFGAANGLIIKNLVAPSRNLYMTDIVDIRTDEIKKIKSLKFIKGTFESTVKKLKNESMSTIIMNNVIEHINDVHNTFKECNRILKKKGRFLIVTDDGDHPFGTLMAMLGHTEHRYCFTKKSFEILSKKFGFKILKYYRMTDNLSYIALEKKW
jgi:SAM-dependent methyltransferase